MFGHGKCAQRRRNPRHKSALTTTPHVVSGSAHEVWLELDEAPLLTAEIVKESNSTTEPLLPQRIQVQPSYPP